MCAQFHKIAAQFSRENAEMGKNESDQNKKKTRKIKTTFGVREMFLSQQKHWAKI